jgi:hypothetical protein
MVLKATSKTAPMIATKKYKDAVDLFFVGGLHLQPDLAL